MNDLITLQNRAIEEPDFDDFDYDETFTDAVPGEDVYALIETINGVTIFDGVATDVNVTHHFYINVIDGITAETWVEFDSRRFDVLRAENLDERSEYMRLICTERGANTFEASKA
jgi:head-tail adaptor